MRMKRTSKLSVVDNSGHRKYLDDKEKQRFLAEADLQERENRMFCLMLYYTGCRPSEALETTYSRVDLVDNCITFRCLKKRKYDGKGLPKESIYRRIPVPIQLIRELDLVFDIQGAMKNTKNKDKRLFTKSRTAYFRMVKNVMLSAGVKGQQGSAKGLRHSYAIALAKSGVDIVTIKKLMGHSDLETTEIYMQFSIQDTATAINKVFEMQRMPSDFVYTEFANRTVT